ALEQVGHCESPFWTGVLSKLGASPYSELPLRSIRTRISRGMLSNSSGALTAIAPTRASPAAVERDRRSRSRDPGAQTVVAVRGLPGSTATSRTWLAVADT